MWTNTDYELAEIADALNIEKEKVGEKMREILFRGKRADNGEWVEGQLLYFQATVGTSELALIVEGCEWDNSNEWFNLGKRAKVIPETIGQYTGLIDKNGTKIFEGDIIKTDNGRVSAISVVQYGNFEPKMFYDLIERYVRSRPKEKLYGLFAKSKCGEEMLLSESSHLIEVIGNIHDNPELLKGGVRK